MTSWMQKFEHEMKHEDDAGPVLAYSPGRAVFEAEAMRDQALELLAWTESRVYFLSSGDEYGEQGVLSAPRNPPEGAA